MSTSSKQKTGTNDFNFNEHMWDVIDSHFRIPNVLVKHLIGSFNNFMDNNI
jgi:hypothetical protein